MKHYNDHTPIVVFPSEIYTQCIKCDEQIEVGEHVRHGESSKSYMGSLLCLKCAKLDHLKFLQSGDQALTRRAKKHSEFWVEVKKSFFNRRRLGILVEPKAYEKAKKECEGDKDIRYRRKEIVCFSYSKIKCKGKDCRKRLQKERNGRLEISKLVVFREGIGFLCQTCADLNLEHLEYLPSGDSSLTQRATHYSEIVVEFRLKVRSTRQGIYVEPEALERARKEWKAAKEIRGVIDYLTSEPKI